MIEVTTRKFIADAEKLLEGVVANDDYLKVSTAAGNAVVISEAEWNILQDALKTVLKITT